MRFTTIAVLLTASVLAGCAPPEPEAQVRAFLDAAAAAVEARQTSFFRQHISSTYTDAEGRNRDDLLGMVRAYFLINSDIEVISRVADIELAGDDFATVVLQAALIGRRERPGVPDLDADLSTIEVDLARDEGEWVLVRARWD